MELRIFNERVYGKANDQLFVFESLWDSFRPIERVAWNGEKFEIVDTKYKKDLFDENYGYGSLEMKALCRKYINETNLEKATEIKDPVEFWKWSGEKEAKWWKDRPIVFANPCVSRDIDSWKNYLHYLNVRAKTLRQPLNKSKLTRRLGIKHIISKNESEHSS